MREKLNALINEADQKCAKTTCENCHAFGKGSGSLGCVNYNIADHLIANGVTIQKWIPVSERLPEEPGKFLIVVKSKYPFDRDYSYETDVAMYRWDGKGRLDGCWDALADWGDGEEYIHVTHWMPLPEPPKEES